MVSSSLLAPAIGPRNPDLLTREEAAAYLGVKYQTLCVWQSTRRYDVPLVKVGRLVRYKKSDLDRWLESRTVGAAE
jgi:excisionase family DNA binding protein